MARYKSYKTQETHYKQITIDKKQISKLTNFCNCLLRFDHCLCFVFCLLMILLVLVPMIEGAESSQPQNNVYALSMEEVTRLALQNNFEIQLAKFDTYISRTDNQEAVSIYDTILDAEVSYHEDKSRRTNTLGGTKSLDNDYNFGLSKKLPTGTTLSVDALNNRHWTNSAFATLNPSHDSSLGVTLEQELGKNFFGLVDRGGIKITQLDVQNAEYLSFENIENSLLQVQKAYWDLVLYYEQLKIAQAYLEQAQTLWQSNQEKFQDGLVEKPELIASEVNYQSRINELMLVENELKSKENTLRLLLNITDDSLRLKPQAFFNLFSNDEELGQSLKLAFENRRDYKRAQNDLKSKNIKLVIEKNNLWPEINLTVSLAQNGVSAENFREASKQISQESNTDILTVLSMSMPLENNSAKAAFKKAGYEKARALVSIKLLERKVSIDIIDQVRTCNILKHVAINSQKIAELQQNKLMEEEKRFKNGRSNTDTIIRFQEDVIQTRREAAQDQFNYQSALIDLRQKEGTLLNQYWQGSI